MILPLICPPCVGNAVHMGLLSNSLHPFSLFWTIKLVRIYKYWLDLIKSIWLIFFVDCAADNNSSDDPEGFVTYTVCTVCTELYIEYLITPCFLCIWKNWSTQKLIYHEDIGTRLCMHLYSTVYKEYSGPKIIFNSWLKCLKVITSTCYTTKCQTKCHLWANDSSPFSGLNSFL